MPVYEIRLVQKSTEETINKTQIRKKYGISAKMLERSCGLVPRYVVLDPKMFALELYTVRDVENAIAVFKTKYGSSDTSEAKIRRQRDQQRSYYFKNHIKMDSKF